MKSLIALWNQMADELAIWCCTSAQKDTNRVLLRSKHEGLSFLTITLPSYGKDFERSLDIGFVDHTSFSSFSKRRGLPVFLGGFLDQVFDRESGRLLDNPNHDAIYSIRQLTLVYGKLFLVSNDRRQARAMSGFVKCEQDIRVIHNEISPSLFDDFSRVSRLLYSRIFRDVDWKIFDLDLRGKHGPGSTADKLLGNKKFEQTTWTRRLEEILPFADFLLVNRNFRELGDSIDILEPEAELPVKVISVPKTQKTPRIIAIEPTCMQFAQQAVSEVLIRTISHSNRGIMIGFDDQTLNQRLAQEGSISGSLATLDLSEASDRVSLPIVDLLTNPYPCFNKAVLACRSTRASVPEHGVIPLFKYASMGSALTFPIEALCFLTWIFMGIEQEHSRQLTERDIKNLSSSVRVYGDDIVVPVKYVRSVVSVLTSFGNVVNEKKSFWTGKFRESCGKEYYDGTDVTVVKTRQLHPNPQQKDATEVISLVSFRNQLYSRGLWQTCRWLDERIRKLLSEYPVVLPTSPVIGRHSFLGYESQRDCPSLHRPLVKGYVVKAKPPICQIDDHAALFKVLGRERVFPFHDPKHLERSGRPPFVNIKMEWAPPY